MFEALIQTLIALILALYTLVGAPPTTLRVTLSEAQINQQVVAQGNPYIDLIPGGMQVRANVTVQRRTLSVTATGTLTLRDDAVLLYLTRIQTEGVMLPGILLDQLNTHVVPAINAELNRLIRAQIGNMPYRLDALSTDNTTLTLTLQAVP